MIRCLEKASSVVQKSRGWPSPARVLVCLSFSSIWLTTHNFFANTDQFCASSINESTELQLPRNKMGWFPAILIAWSALVVLAYLFELGLYYYDRGLGKWTAILPRLHQVRKKIYVLVWASSLPLLLTCLVHMLSRVSSIRDSQSRLKLDQPSTKGDDEESINADIAGDGVRYAMITQAVVLALAILLGLFHSNRTAVKELGMVILACKSYFVSILIAIFRAPNCSSRSHTSRPWPFG
jgi:hypothetical protein